MIGFVGGAFIVNAATIEDSPRFPWRGALVDTSRHFQPLAVLRAFIDALSYSKMNVLHWHITDDSSFPYVSVQFPALSAMGAYAAPGTSHTYSQADIAALISFAKDRGVRVVAEFDTPGHSESWGLGQAGLLTQCYNATGPDGTYGPIDPTLNSTWTFLDAFFAEVAGTVLEENAIVKPYYINHLSLV